MDRWLSLLAARRAGEMAVAEREDPRVRDRRRVVAAVVTLAGAATLAWALRIAPGDALFYPATLALAVVWGLGARLAGRPLRATGEHDSHHRARLALLGLGVGLVLLGVFLLGAAVVAQVPPLRVPVQQLLAHAEWGSLPVVLAITVVNGIVEELFFRGTLYDALGGRRAVLVTTVLYTVVTALSGIPLLALAALLLGLAVAVLRRLTRGVLAPIVAHLTWSVGMLLLLGPTLALLEPR
ncbi:type II CAAX prenyl endopeptidase Rce1 family protein [Arsenicicoccus dermatophilus]|uniref:CPBP family glutamic-type intramembrane protease n=1 Tax=Arsenicicoccus dermatophilus TaxID=1076331 RepID=UPI001F4D1D3F|nr:CPBP family glutamic-type intramembrane protease [Arsenicicoccus dermatophilus]MCH8611918.1 CPBP family glutamic-type intramembrane protease [Arsenicicoccus dermatophilus]